MDNNKSQNPSWYIEGTVGDSETMMRLSIGEKPIRVGRQKNLDLVLHHISVSRVHAELYVRNGCLFVRDCGSSNGTFVNRERIESERELHAGDVVHFAACEFLVGRAPHGVDSSASLETIAFSSVLPEQHACCSNQLMKLIEGEHVRSVYEPIVDAKSGQVWAYEALGRGALENFFESPMELFTLAKPLGLEAELSRVFRRSAVAHVPVTPPPGGLFLNTHPAEMSDMESLLASLRKLRKERPELALVVELPELYVTNDEAIGVLREQLAAMNVKLAYDDFGAGQARLVELARVPPDYLKFDKKLIKKIACAESSVSEMLSMLVAYAHDLGSLCVAEGVETEDDSSACKDLGFDFLQGYLFLSLTPTPP
jgi:EAL domain-containing protein (putative c-di-GMP-specific phosphodiesterase class I)